MRAATLRAHPVLRARSTPVLIAQASVHGSTTAFAVAAGIFAAGAIVAAALFERGVPAGAPVGEPFWLTSSGGD